ncbi:hypothetical protein MLP_32250 [Microlunatus phosphovorus NM-1]|uniref:DUF559 domain-containing protein n=1 Tax=Microlunatus phosphovorus (strain ATCC 700054 / DSM 10555 / JCM 9379 / NBRC 101784 / NCIMB 13414 / VKM Ac-1990 / NM-1) TaxID=1032480 RepID=F5XLH3_MICPN|nr:hypothetical protein [Microlunatus phosphovorus]BAK36239.1 hypothetical protein MLP_32250 [Microlunatus phosphovorus NM-1]
MSRFAEEWAQTRVSRSRADWARREIGRGTLRGQRYDRATPGYYRATSGQRDGEGAVVNSAQRIRDAQSVMPSGALIAGWAAAYAHGIDALDGLDHLTMKPLPVPVLLPPGSRRRSTPEIRYRQSIRQIRGDVIEGIPVTMLLRTAYDLAREAPDLTEAVAALDAILRTRRLKPEHLQRNLGRIAGHRGSSQARQAVDLARIGVRSTWESRLRMLAVLELGLLDLQPNRAVFDHQGYLLGIPDLLDVDAGLALEYDGGTWRSDRAEGHRDRDQHREDNAREERLERAGLIVVRAEKRDLTTYRRQLIGRIATARADGLRRDRTRDRWTLDEPSDWYGYDYYC